MIPIMNVYDKDTKSINQLNYKVFNDLTWVKLDPSSQNNFIEEMSPFFLDPPPWCKLHKQWFFILFY